MKIVHGFDSLPKMHRPAATLGSFDGVHCGHTILLDKVSRLAAESDGDSVVLTFEPHPRITLHKDDGLKLLTTFEEKAYLLERCGIDYVIIIPFDEEFSRLSREEFVEEYLTGKLGIEKLVVGYNHHFGRNKEGDYSFLAGSAGIAVAEVEQQLVGSDKVSSTVIRRRVENGDMRNAVRLLGHPYIIIGMTDAEGTIATDRYKLLPPDGEYAARINGQNGKIVINNGKVCRTGIRSEKAILELV